MCHSSYESTSTAVLSASQVPVSPQASPTLGSYSLSVTPSEMVPETWRKSHNTEFLSVTESSTDGSSPHFDQTESLHSPPSPAQEASMMMSASCVCALLSVKRNCWDQCQPGPVRPGTAVTLKSRSNGARKPCFPS